MKTKRKALLFCLCLTLGLVSCSGKDKTSSEFGDYGKNADSLIQNSEYTDNEKEPEQKTPIYKLPPENAAANACGDNLTTVKLPKSVTSIGAAAFGRKSNITNIYYAGSESEWENIEVGKYNDIFDTAVIHYNSK